MLVILYYGSLHGIAAKMYKAHLLNGETTYIFTPTGFDYRSGRATSSNTWAAVDKLVETRRSFLLIYANTMFVLVPFACVPANDMQYLRRLFGDHLGARAKMAG